jgi:hypothetical protein
VRRAPAHQLDGARVRGAVTPIQRFGSVVKLCIHGQENTELPEGELDVRLVGKHNREECVRWQKSMC